MSSEGLKQPDFHLRDMLRHGAEPPPAAFIVRRTWYPWLIVGVTCVGAFIGQLDASIVQLALPTLATAFDASLSAVSWVSLAYLLAFASCLPIFGRLCEMYGRKLLYLSGYLLFTVATVLCGLAPDLPWLVAFRVLQGIGGSILGANSIAILVKAVDSGQRGRAMGIFAAAQAVGVSAGPAVGGLLLGAFGWRWMFWASAPFGLVVAVIGWWALPQTVGRAADKRFDWRGALLLAPALTALILVINQAGDLGLASPLLLGCAAVAVVLMTLLVRHERASTFPLVDLRLFQERGFSAGAMGALLGYAMIYAMFFLMSFALVRGYHDSAQQAGVRLAIIPVAIGLVAPFSGGLSTRLGTRLLSVAGMAFCIGAIVVLSVVAMEPDTSRMVGFVALAAFGAGLGVFIAPNNTATIGAAPADLSGSAGAMLNLMRVLGTSLGVASSSAMLSWRFGAISHGDGRPIADGALLGAVESSLVMVAAFAAIAACLSLLRDRRAA
jgi:EmrB/QacA subfamily drug resistance transporter